MPPKKTARAAGDKRKRKEDDSLEDSKGAKAADAVKEEREAKEEDAAGEGDRDVKSETKEDQEEEKPQPEPPAKSRKLAHSTPLDWLLSDEAFELANPIPAEGRGEIDLPPSEQSKATPTEEAGKLSAPTSEQEGSYLRYPHSPLTPFQNLICACILSKPLSHRLGLRTIHTLLNPPFGLRTLKDLDEAGYEGRRKVMWEARTQHKEKTAGQLGNVVDGVRELCDGTEDETELDNLEGLKEKVSGMKGKEAQEVIVKHLTKIKGIGPGVASIFLRRVQGDWEEVYPYADDRCLADARRFGLIEQSGGAEELAEVVGGDRRRFVRLLDTLIGIELEKKMDEAMQAAGAGK